MKKNNFLTPPFLKKNNRIGILAPAGVFNDKEVLNKAVSFLEQNGWQAKIYPQTFEKFGSLAGTDTIRLNTLQHALNDDEIQALWCVRGGYGSIRIVDRLDFSKFEQHPKWLIGFSDITVFHLKFFELQIQSIHGIMPVQFKDNLPDDVLIKTAQTLRGNLPSYNIHRDSMNMRERNTEGILIGGNAATLLSYITSCSVDFHNKILFLEDVGENLYALDRIFQSFKRAGIFNRIKGLVLGYFTDIKQDNPPFPYTVKQIVSQAVGEAQIPVFFGFPAGHEPDNYPLVFGHTYRIEVLDDTWSLIPENYDSI